MGKYTQNTNIIRIFVYEIINQVINQLKVVATLKILQDNMNNQRRRSLKQLIKQLEGLTEKFEELKSEVEDVVTEIEYLRDEEEEAYDNLPEGIQNGERGERMQEVIDSLDSATGQLEDVDVDDILSYINDAIDSINEAIC